MGTNSFSQLLFDKVYKDDITRLRSMEEMWKTRRAPEALDYSTVAEKAKSLTASKDLILKSDQRPWTLEENLVVFDDR
jgi:ubiquitin-like 1-activating enzyme E1 B